MFFTGSRSSEFSEQDLSDNPFQPCPGSPNCIRYSRSVAAPAESTFFAALSAVQQMKPKQLTHIENAFRIEAVFKVFLFQDDLLIQITSSPDGQQTRLHLKSASRTGYSDLGVNRRRVRTFLKHIHQDLSP